MTFYTYHGPVNIEAELIEEQEENKHLRQKLNTLIPYDATEKDLGEARLLAATREAYGGKAARR